MKVDKMFFNRIGNFHDGGFKNESHFIRYDMNDLRHMSVHNGAGVTPVYKYQSFYQDDISNMKRGRDSRDMVNDVRLMAQRDKENSRLILDNPFQ